MMTRVLRDQSANPTTILSSSSSLPQSTMHPVLPSSAPAQSRYDRNEYATPYCQQQDKTSSQTQNLCPDARLRMHLDDLTHPAIPIFTRVAPLSSLLDDAITQVQKQLFTPPNDDSPSARPPGQRPLPPNDEVWAPQEVRSITLYLQNMDGVAYTTGTDLDEAHKEIHFSLNYIRDTIKRLYGDSVSTNPKPKADASFVHEIRGVVTHEMVHAFQHNGNGSCPGGLVEGIADYVRLKAGLGAEHWNPWPAGPRTRGDQWDEGYQKTAWFLEWVENNIGGNGAIGRLNQALRKKEWADGNLWEEVIGKTVKQCWRLYKEDWDRLNEQQETPTDS